MRFGIAAILTVSAAALTHLAPAVAHGAPEVDACGNLKNQSFETTADAPGKILTAELVAARPAAKETLSLQLVRSRALGAPMTEDSIVPAHCKVTGYVAPAIRFELYLPEQASWNGKFLLNACDGYCGKIYPVDAIPGLVRNYASLVTDGGHVGDHPFDAVWAYNNPQGRIDFGHRANHVLAQQAKAIISSYYGGRPRLAYITGCSKGGTAGVIAAQRYPEDFDGVLARGPVLEYQAKNVLHFPWVVNAVSTPDGKVLLDGARAPLIERAVMQSCDGADGLKDGLIADPRQCSFQPRTLQCEGGGAGEDCLSATEVGALEKLYAKARDRNGREIYPVGIQPGSEGEWPMWVLPVGGDVETFYFKAASQALKYMAFANPPGPRYDWRSFDPATEMHKLAEVSKILDVTSTDLTAFQRRGGKMILLHGLSDGAVSPLMTARWYEAMTEQMGGPDKAQEVARLFLLPGTRHCGPGNGPETYEGLAALEAWVQQGKAPDMLLTRRELEPGAGRTRPVYPYPLQAKYKGTGSIDDAASFAPAPSPFRSWNDR